MSSFPESLSYFVFENITPLVNNGEYPLKREPGDEVIVEADIFRTGHEKIGAGLIYRKQGDSAWKKSPMEHVNNDLWRGSFKVDQIGFYEYGLEAWTLPTKKKSPGLKKRSSKSRSHYARSRMVRDFPPSRKMTEESQQGMTA
jgi:starch synthase (maltosyl-transferring)